MKKNWSLWLMLGVLPLTQGCVPLMATGAVGTGLVAQDRRTTGAQLDDEDIQIHMSEAISRKYGSDVNVNASSFNRNLLLTGQVPDEATRSDVDAMAHKLTNVRQVIDDIRIGPPSSLAQRAEDAYLTTKVNTRFITDNDSKFSPLQVSVTSSGDIVYLMGLVTQGEGDAAAKLASTTSGVKKVVKVFEYSTASIPASEANPAVKAESGPPAPVQAPAPVEEGLPATTQPVSP